MVFNKAVPGLKVTDMAASLEFYQVMLGFDCHYQNKAFARLCINEVELHLWVATEKVKHESHPEVRADAYCRICVSDLNALYEAYQVTGAIDPSATKIVRQPWGQNDFTVMDLCGNAIVFYQEPVG